MRILDNDEALIRWIVRTRFILAFLVGAALIVPPVLAIFLQNWQAPAMSGGFLLALVAAMWCYRTRLINNALKKHAR